MNCFSISVSGRSALILLEKKCTDPQALCRVLEDAEADRGIDFIRLRGADGSFTIGRAVSELQTFGEKEARVYAERGQRLVKTMRGLKKLIIAEIDGEAFGPGFEIALACDIIFATASSRFAFPEVNLGVIPGFGGTQLAARRVYETFVKYLVFTGDSVTAEELYAKGIANAVFADGASMNAHTDALCARLSEKSSFILGLAKETLNSGIEMDFDKALLFEQNAFTFSFSCEDKREGMGAFIEKRKPMFKNRWEDLRFEEE
ncbi:enoyl-CoA hydratase/isomerase family protein [Geovibrio thiophilus]|uniref:Enoyl-CoA hydratase/isomerase family protein n=1 Tax=Geovibrio thiophilus TaxID=139438 RepID=A0A410JVW8_9BACT|nr:enoyl-CoA hydratase-related protein [Geovibrio thiophilus]QAR32303.1 enoyl-CoA hydratase/isomerase family protein [Geovibrio thiophilus]